MPVKNSLGQVSFVGCCWPTAEVGGRLELRGVEKGFGASKSNAKLEPPSGVCDAS